MADKDGDGKADRVTLAYSERIRHALDTDHRYPFEVAGYTVRKVGRASGSSLTLLLVEKSDPDQAADPAVTYDRTRSKPVRDRAGNQAKNQKFVWTFPLAAIYVSATTGNDAAPGTRGSPKLTVAGALAELEAADADDIFVRAGPYPEGSGVLLVDNVSITGGFNASWKQSTAESVISGSPQAVLANNAVGARLRDLTLQGNAPVGAGLSAYGIRAISGSSLSLQRVKVSASAGRDGLDGAMGDPGLDGLDGNDATGNTGASGGTGPGGAGGTGGRGGILGGAGVSGGAGEPEGAGGTGGSGGPGSFGDTPEDGVAGQAPAASGAAGLAGTNAPFTLALAGATWVGAQGTAGGGGSPGAGGGGGGGGGGFREFVPEIIGFINLNGGGGGGGGAGGLGGAGGARGFSGGGSFGIYLHNSSATVDGASVIAAGDGGHGGDGGAGGQGGGGGAFGEGIEGPSGARGGDGGNGADGGVGGGGGGGPGGPSFGIFRAGTSTVTFSGKDPTITFGAGGLGGLLGGSLVQRAGNGQAGAIDP